MCASGSAAHIRSLSPSGLRRARDDGETRDPDLDSVDSGEDTTDLVKTKSHETLLTLQSAMDGLSQPQLLSVKDIWFRRLLSRPMQGSS